MKPEIRVMGGGVRRVELVPTNEVDDVFVVSADSPEVDNCAVRRIGLVGLSDETVGMIADGTKDARELLRFTSADKIFAPVPGVDLVAEICPVDGRQRQKWVEVRNFREFGLL